MAAGALNLWVFRDERRCVSGPGLRKKLAAGLDALPERPSEEALLRLLLRAGELECGVADSGSSPEPLHQLADALADSFVGCENSGSRQAWRELLANTDVPDTLHVSVPEGFAYYALHPRAYADVLPLLPLMAPNVVVVGIRSIGTTLSAVVGAALRKTGRKAVRFTVRPAGHPYNRETSLRPQQQEVVHAGLACGADFLVVDEGPGLSGSSFLSAGEALLAEGVPAENMRMICGRQPDFASFRTLDGPKRAGRFHWIAVDSNQYHPRNGKVLAGAGEWRRLHFADEDSWPPSWTWFERSKYISAEADKQRRLYKFLGLGHYGDEVFAREQEIAAAGFAAPLRREANGFASCDWLRGRPMRPSDLNEDSIRRLASYCAFRACSFAAESSDLKSLQQMADYNLQQLSLPLSPNLCLERPVIADGRMQPHEWILMPDGEMLKTDSGTHGDDHFFPGPTDIAWDLAGAIVEWRMDELQREAFLESYTRFSGDHSRERIGDYVPAYCVFCAAYCLMAANALHGSQEQRILEREADYYKMALVTRGPDLIA
ncbi:MAG: hypothetical protein ACM3SW_09500 [Actinomycetota bacterium]